MMFDFICVCIPSALVNGKWKSFCICFKRSKTFFSIACIKQIVSNNFIHSEQFEYGLTATFPINIHNFVLLVLQQIVYNLD